MITLGRQRGFLLVTMIVTLFLLATIAVLLAKGSAVSAHTSNSELEDSRSEYVAQAGMQHALWQAGNNACMGNLTIPATSLGADSYTAAITGAAAGTAFTLTADQDAWIRSDDVTKVNGTTSDQHIKFDSGNIEQTLTRFDLTSLPAEAPINSATAWFHVDGAHAEGPVTVHRITADWTESDATWQSMSGKFEDSTLATIAAQPANSVWVAINLTAQVQAWVNGQPNYGILMASTAEGVHAKYASREAGSNAPRLEVVVGSGPASPVNLQATGVLSNGVTRTIDRPLVAAYQTPLVQTITPDPIESADAEIWAQAANNNYGDAAETWVSSASNDTTRTLLRFDTGTIPTGVHVVDATLSLYRQSGSGADQPVSAHRVTKSWSEDSVTWNDRNAGTSWDKAGGDFDSAAVATTPVGPGNQRYEWDTTSLVQAWLDGTYPNHGIAMVAAIDGMAGERFYTSDQAVLDRRPSLSVRYACECGTTCMAPVTSGDVLLVIGNSPSNPSAEEEELIEQLESWGYAVTLIQDDDSQGNFDSGSTANDVVLVSDTVNSANVGSKLTNTSAGVVTVEPDLIDDLGIATGSASTVSETLAVTDTSHYITSVFIDGTLPIKTAATALSTVGGTTSPDANVLAEAGGVGALVAIDRGAAAAGGGTIGGRRVLLPIGNGAAGWRYLTNNAALIVQRSLAWAMSADINATGKLLLVVGSINNLSTKDADRKTTLESWGYAVALIDDGDSQASFDTALAANDVVYVSDSVGSKLAGKLDSSTLGIVNEAPENLDNFGFGSQVPANTISASLFDTTDASHYISAPFAGAGVTHFNSNIAMPVASGTLAPDLGNVAALSFLTFAIPILDTNAERWDGAPSPGRRVNLPFGAANVSQLTADGLTLMQRSIVWAAGLEDNSGKSVLMVVVEPSDLTAQETAKKVLMESWGFTVIPVDESASQGDFDTAVAGADVAYVPEDITSGTLGTKLRTADIGVVIEEEKITDEFGISSGETTFIEGSIEITNNSHYITEPFSLGAVTFSSVSQQVGGRAGTMAPGLVVLAQRPSSATSMLDAIDAGGALYDTGTAAGRRVKLPWGGNDFDINSLTSDGQAIMRRAIEWGAESATVSLAPIAHWKLDDASGTTAIDSAGGHDGTLVNGPAWSTGQIGGALDFDGSNDLVNVAHDDSLSLLGQMTFTAWINASSFGSSYQAILAKDGGGQGSNYFFGTWQRDLVFGFYAGGFFREVFTSDLNLQTGSWNHVAASFDNATGQVLLYVNGSQVRDGTVGHSASAVDADITIGRSPDGEHWRGLLDDVRIYDTALSSAEIAELAGAGGGGGGGGGSGSYTEAYEEWTASQSDQWQVKDLSLLGVPANAVVEVAVIVDSSGSQKWGGVRAVGSALDRRLQLHESEGGGRDVFVMHVQSNGNSEIEYYADQTSDVYFALLGYWNSGAYVERFDSFNASSSGSWQDRNLNSYGVSADQVAEIVIANTASSSKRIGGVRENGSGFGDRFIEIHEAESGGVDTSTMLVTADNTSNATIEVYAESSADIDFYLVGYWSTPPGTFVESNGSDFDPGSPSGVWSDWDLSGDGVPANAVAYVAIANGDETQQYQIGVRQKGSTNDRWIDLQESEGGGYDTASWHALVDANSMIQFYDEDAQENHRYRVLGWWVLP